MRIIQKKICLLGDFSVGKTSLVRRFIEDKFDDKYMSTIGVKISRKPVHLEDTQVDLMLWDLAGGDEFSEISPRYLAGASGALIVCDLTRVETLDLLSEYAEKLLKSNSGCVLVFAGNKVDLLDERAISDEQLAGVAAKFFSPWFLTSAKTGEHVEEAFFTIAEKVE